MIEQPLRAVRLRTVTGFASWLTAALCVMPFAASAEQQQRDAVDDYVERAMARQHVPGLSLVVLRNGRVIKAKGYGLANVEHRAPATPATVYELASTTKPFVASAILLLGQDGTLGLDDDIARWIDGVPVAWRGVTIRHLLTHTSGIKDYLADLRHDFRHDTPADTIARTVLAAPANFAPGTRWQYSNSGYVLLGLVVRKASGEPWDAFLKRRVFGPLAMTATRRDTPDEIVPARAGGYLWYGAGGMHNGDYLKYLTTNHGDRGLLSTALDLARFDAALGEGRLLTAASREAMWRPVTLNDGTTHGYGLGWFIESSHGHRHIHHPGGAPGTAALISRYPDDGITIILLANGGAAYPQALDLGIAQRYIPALAPGPVATVATQRLDSYTGFYNVFGSQLLTIRREGGALSLDDGGRLANRFVALSDSTFVAEDADRGVTVRRSPSGAVSGLTLRLAGDTMSVRRIGALPARGAHATDPDPALTRDIETVLRAFERGGVAVERVARVAPQARRDYAFGPAPEFAGIRGIRYITSYDVQALGMSRHGAGVARVLVYELSLERRRRTVLVYLTADGMVTDQDVVD